MHRFEIRLLADTLVGECPRYYFAHRLEDKRDFLDSWMQRYYRIHGQLPRGCHRPTRPRHGLSMGTVDFDAARERLACRLARDVDRTWRRMLRGGLGARFCACGQLVALHAWRPTAGCADRFRSQY